MLKWPFAPWWHPWAYFADMHTASNFTNPQAVRVLFHPAVLKTIIEVFFEADTPATITQVRAVLVAHHACSADPCLACRGAAVSHRVFRTDPSQTRLLAHRCAGVPYPLALWDMAVISVMSCGLAVQRRLHKLAPVLRVAAYVPCKCRAGP